MESGTKDYMAKIKEMYSNIPPSKQARADELMQRLNDILKMMDQCKAHIAEDGCVVPMSQGKYSIDRESPWSKAYDAKHKLMLATMDKLDKMVPDSEGNEDELEAFLKSADDAV